MFRRSASHVRRRSSWSAGRIGLLAGAYGLASVGCNPAADPPAAPSPSLDTIVLIVIDTIRRDHMSVYGHSTPNTPRLEELAVDAVRFERAYSQAPWTTPSVGSLLTSRYPSELGIRHDRSILPVEVPTLAQALQAAGYSTAAVVSNSFVSAKWGFSRGFDVFDESNVKTADAVTGESVSDRAIEIIENHDGRPLFLFLLYFDPHVAYVGHEEHGFEADPEYDGPIHSGMRYRDLTPLRQSLAPEDMEVLAEIYDSEIGYTDRAIGRVLDALRAADRYDDALIIVTGDHGEEFLEHGFLGHAKSVYDELVRVPLLIRPPGGKAEIDERVVELVDVLPTVLETAGLSPLDSARGRPLLNGEAADETAFTETSRRRLLRAVIQGDRKLVVDERSGEVELYDLAEDPGEQRDLSTREPDRVKALRGELDAWRRQHRSERAEELQELDERERERLEALGYL